MTAMVVSTIAGIANTHMPVQTLTASVASVTGQVNNQLMTDFYDASVSYLQRMSFTGCLFDPFPLDLGSFHLYASRYFMTLQCCDTYDPTTYAVPPGTINCNVTQLATNGLELGDIDAIVTHAIEPGEYTRSDTRTGWQLAIGALRPEGLVLVRTMPGRPFHKVVVGLAGIEWAEVIGVSDGSTLNVGVKL